MHPGGDGGGVENELEEERDVVDWDKDRSAAASRRHEKEDHGSGFQELDGEEATCDRGEDGEFLLDGEDDEEDA